MGSGTDVDDSTLRIAGLARRVAVLEAVLGRATEETLDDLTDTEVFSITGGKTRDEEKGRLRYRRELRELKEAEFQQNEAKAKASEAKDGR